MECYKCEKEIEESGDDIHSFIGFDMVIFICSECRRKYMFKYNRYLKEKHDVEFIEKYNC